MEAQATREGTEQLALAVALDAGHAHDLARAHREVHAVEGRVGAGAGHGQPGDGEHHLRVGRERRRREGRGRIAAEIRALCDVAFKQKPSDVRSLIIMAKSQLVGSPERPDECRPGACEALSHNDRRQGS